jgi:transposase
MYPPELGKRAVRMVAEIRGDYPTETAALNSVMETLGIGSRETLRKWFRQDQIDTGQRPGTTSEEAAQVKALKKEIAELKRANEILKAASAFSRPSSTSHTRARSVHGRDARPLRRCRAEIRSV